MAKYMRKKILEIISAVTLLLTGRSVSAASFKDSLDFVDTIRDGAGIKDFGTVEGFFEAVLAPVLSFLGIIAICVFVYAGVMYVMAAGDESKVKNAKWIMIYAAIGMLVIGLTVTVVNVIISIIT